MTYLKPLQVYAGWRVLIGAFICAALATGFTTIMFGMFVVPVTEEFGISRADVNNGFIAYMLGGAILVPIAGQLLDRFSVRWIIAGAGLIFGASLMLLSRLDTLWLMLALIAVPITFGGSACGVLGANTVVVRWFHNRRGRALGILSLSVSVAAIFSQPITALLIETLGWRDALFTIGVITALGFSAMALLLIRDRPIADDPGYDQEFSAPAASEGEHQSQPLEQAWAPRQLIRNRNFWLMATGIGLLFGTDQAVLISQVAYFQDLGYELSTVALLVTVKAVSAACGKLVIGLLADKVDLRWLYCYVAGSSATLLAIYTLQPSFTTLLVSVALLGVAVGGVYPVWTTIMAWLFGSRSYGTVMGMVGVIIQLTAIGATRFIGVVHDKAGSYAPAFITFIVLVSISIILISLLRPTPPQV